MGDEAQQVICDVVSACIHRTAPVTTDTEWQALPGWDSIVIVRAIGEIQRRLAVRVPIPIFTQGSRVGDVVRWVNDKLGSKHAG